MPRCNYEMKSFRCCDYCDKKMYEGETGVASKVGVFCSNDCEDAYEEEVCYDDNA